jgi:ATPase subunit of ABC transporter with duplicated ATPase domains
MTSIRCSNLEFAYRDDVPVLRDLAVHLHAGWYGLVAGNGAGKSTFLRLLRGDLSPDRGLIVREPEHGRIVLCEQEVELPGPDVLGLAERDDGPGRLLRAQLGLEPAQLQRWEVLSPGERKRWQVAAALAQEPDVLLLDEPANHLDAGARERLAVALSRFRGVGVLVAHDRELLDRLTEQTLRLEGGRITATPGGYSAARAIWEREARHQQDQRRLAQARVRRLERQLDEVRRSREAAALQRSTGRRMKDRHDSDARTVAAQTRVEWAEARLGRGVGAVQTQLDRARAEITPNGPERELGGAVFARYQPARRQVVLSLDRPTLEAGGRPLLGQLKVALRRSDRVWLSGDNGAGKTTLLRALVGASSLPAQRLLCLPQELSAAESLAMLDELRAEPGEVKGRVLSVVAALGCDPARLLASGRPSPGEARKLAIALGLGRHVWALILDEPTNHLDLPSVERLERALGAFPGALLLVTHDRVLAERCTTTRWHLTSGELQVCATSDAGDGTG